MDLLKLQEGIGIVAGNSQIQPLHGDIVIAAIGLTALDQEITLNQRHSISKGRMAGVHNSESGVGGSIVPSTIIGGNIGQPNSHSAGKIGQVIADQHPNLSQIVKTEPAQYGGGILPCGRPANELDRIRAGVDKGQFERLGSRVLIENHPLIGALGKAGPGGVV